jgi:hypothetical protein
VQKFVFDKKELRWPEPEGCLFFMPGNAKESLVGRFHTIKRLWLNRRIYVAAL